MSGLFVVAIKVYLILVAASEPIRVPIQINATDHGCSIDIALEEGDIEVIFSRDGLGHGLLAAGMALH